MAQWMFSLQESWFLFTLVLFIAGQSILKYSHLDNLDLERDLVAALRLFIYVFSMTQLIWMHGSKSLKQIRKKELIWLWGKIPIPAYLKSWQDSAGTCLTIPLVLILIFESILWCMASKETRDAWVFQRYAEADDPQCLTESSPDQLARPVQLDKLTRYPPITGGVRNGSPTLKGGTEVSKGV